MRETVAHFHVSKCTVSKRRHCFILHLGDGKQRAWHQLGSHAELLLEQRGACGGGSRIFGWHFKYGRTGLVQINGTSNATKYHLKILARHLLPYWDALGHQKAPHFSLLDNNCTPHTARLVTARLVSAPSQGVLRSRLTWVSHGVQSRLRHARLNKCFPGLPIWRFICVRNVTFMPRHN